ncbi:MAG: type I-F CRISPR-associated protein Csy1 [SAR86 cluster bacterium]|uniref:Type I-F CRISPR-associated protein Csy1 n=1 Tax=SAR86 cluster bacterium TaxID=2030880 RepID=A0A2A5C7R4_9GAMM|nr:MAG: type I-F CRISPR-associated protein Csy1 [SAR86 cluster bacterium]
MIDDLKKYIDALVKKKLKESGGSHEKAGLPFTIIDGKEGLEYSAWLINLVSTDVDGYLPVHTKQVELLGFLCFELLYKQSIKSLVDSEHYIINEALMKLSLVDKDIRLVISRVAKFNADKLDYFELFKEEIESDENTLKAIHEKIDAISEDSCQGTIISHSAKMTNPVCKYPKLCVSASSGNDGYIRTGNNDVEFDLHINATKLKVFKFLSLKIEGKSILELVRCDDVASIAATFSVPEDQVLVWISNFNSCVSEQDVRTHLAIKQIYFPVDNEYHQLSVLQPSGLVFLLKQRVDFINDRSANAYYGKKARKENKYFESGYASVPSLTVTRHGGDHPKNISGLNNKYQSYYLLSSEPPKLTKRDIHFPTIDFFSQSLNYYQCRSLFYALHELFLDYKNNWYIRLERDDFYQTIIDRIIERMWSVRSVSETQYNEETSQLNKTQKNWLCNEHEGKREGENDWLDELCKDITSFIFNGYEKVLGKKAFMFSDDEYKHIHKQVVKNKEALR